jgi:hypothetical protein
LSQAPFFKRFQAESFVSIRFEDHFYEKDSPFDGGGGVDPRVGGFYSELFVLPGAFQVHGIGRLPAGHGYRRRNGRAKPNAQKFFRQMPPSGRRNCRRDRETAAHGAASIVGGFIAYFIFAADKISCSRGSE